MKQTVLGFEYRSPLVIGGVAIAGLVELVRQWLRSDILPPHCR